MITSYLERWDLAKEGYRVAILRDGDTLEWCETTADGCTTGRGDTLDHVTMPTAALDLISTFMGEGYEFAGHEQYDPGQLLAYLSAEQALDIERARTASAEKLLAEAERDRLELRDKRTDLLEIRGILSPADGPRRVPADVEMVAAAAPAVQWIADELDRVRAERDQLRRQLDAAEAAPCGHDGTSFDALERLHARIHRDFNFDAGECAPPTQDEPALRMMDDLVTFADEVYMPLADATKAPSETPPAAASPSRFDFTTLLEPEPPAPAPHRVTVTTVHHINMTDDNDHYDEPSYEVHHTPQCDALPYGEDCWIDHQHRDVGTDDWPTEPGEYIASGEAVKSFNGEYTEYDFYMDFEPVPNTLESAVAEARADIATTPADPEPAPIRHAWLLEAGDD